MLEIPNICYIFKDVKYNIPIFIFDILELPAFQMCMPIFYVQNKWPHMSQKWQKIHCGKLRNNLPRSKIEKYYFLQLFT